jgi:DNA polymerase-3 subunit delta
MASNAAGRRIFRSLAAGEPWSPIYLVYGPESFLVEELVKAIRKAVLGDAPSGEFGDQVIDGDEVSGQSIRQELENLPLFGGQRLLHVRNVAAMKDEDLEALRPYLDNPAPETCLLLSDRSVDKRKRFFKAITKCKSATVVEFKSLYDNELPGWVGRRARSKGLRGMGRELAELVAELTGPDLAPMDSALDKLALYAKSDDRPIDEEMVLHLLDDTRVRNIFELTELLGARELAKSLDALHRMLEQGQSAVGLVAMIARHFRIVWKVKGGLARGLGQRQLASLAGCPPRFVGGYESDARGFSDARLGEVLCAIHQAEKTLKSSGLKDELVVTNLVMEVCL